MSTPTPAQPKSKTPPSPDLLSPHWAERLDRLVSVLDPALPRVVRIIGLNHGPDGKERSFLAVSAGSDGTGLVVTGSPQSLVRFKKAIEHYFATGEFDSDVPSAL
jgi:hypothetical protein